jgi:hypothetical protein
MDWLTIKGGTVYDGRYQFDLEGSDFTVREWGWLKRHAGYLPLTIEDGFAGADPELYAVFAVIALHRAKRIGPADVARVLDVLADTPGILTIRFETDQPEEAGSADVDPPMSPTSSTGNGRSSGDSSKPSSETSPAIPSASGTPASATSESRPVT